MSSVNKNSTIPDLINNIYPFLFISFNRYGKIHLPKSKSVERKATLDYQILKSISKQQIGLLDSLLAYYLRLFPADRQTLEVYVGILKSYLYDGFGFIDSYSKRFYSLFRMIEDLYISFRKLTEALLKSFCPIIHCQHTEGELTLNGFSSALRLVVQPYWNICVVLALLAHHSASTNIVHLFSC